MQNNRSFSSSTLLVLGLILVTLNLLHVDCKPIKLANQHQLKTIIKSPQDLIAMPNEQYKHSAETQPVHYVAVEPQQEQNAQVNHAPTTGDKQEITYYMLPDGQTIEASQYMQQQQQQQQQRTGTDKPCNDDKSARVEYQTVAYQEPQVGAVQIPNGYPGEIIYTNRAGEYVTPFGEPIANQAHQYERPSIELVTRTGKSLRESTRDLTATILTEIPLNDISKEVLEQLKKDYGAKVVATREYPGADLVINCAEHSGLGVSLCSNNKQPPITSYEPDYEANDEPRIRYVAEEHKLIESTPILSEAGYRRPEAESEGELIEREHESEHESEKIVPVKPDDQIQQYNHQEKQNNHNARQFIHETHPIETNEANREQHQQPEQNQYSTYQTSTTPTYDAPTSAYEPTETTGEPVVPTNAYNVEVTSSGTSQLEQKIAPMRIKSINEKVKQQSPSNIMHNPDALSSISQQEEKIEK